MRANNEAVNDPSLHLKDITVWFVTSMKRYAFIDAWGSLKWMKGMIFFQCSRVTFLTLYHNRILLLMGCLFIDIQCCVMSIIHTHNEERFFCNKCNTKCMSSKPLCLCRSFKLDLWLDFNAPCCHGTKILIVVYFLHADRQYKSHYILLSLFHLCYKKGSF